MSRLFAFFTALLVSAVTVSSACTASSASDATAHALRFSLEPARQSGRIHASFRRTDRNNSNWSTDFAPSDFTGLDLARLRGSGSGPIQFAMGREAGRLDCAGNGGNAMATGTCRFTADANFTNYLISRGVRRPDSDQAFALMAVNAAATLSRP
ncbi:MAG: hypothetical protein M3Q52_11830 [Pseudomonadota bacterium]|nr:hypothetical protein [Pseudomonadota bacterium]